MFLLTQEILSLKMIEEILLVNATEKILSLKAIDLIASGAIPTSFSK